MYGVPRTCTCNPVLVSDVIAVGQQPSSRLHHTVFLVQIGRGDGQRSGGTERLPSGAFLGRVLDWHRKAALELIRIMNLLGKVRADCACC